MPIVEPEGTTEGPFTILVNGVNEGEKLEEISGLVSRHPEGPPEGEEDRPIVFNDVKQAQKWLSHNLDEEAVNSLEWRIITTTEALEIDQNLKLDSETKKFV